MPAGSASTFASCIAMSAPDAITTPVPSRARPHARARGIGVLFNPGSGANLKAPGRMRAVHDAHPELAWHEVSGPATVARALAALAQADVQTVVISGGDGTVQAALGVLFGDASPYPEPPALVILRSGTTNMIAGDVGPRGRPDHALSRLLERAARGDALPALQRPVLRIDPGARRAPICGMYFGAAAIVQGVEYCTGKLHRVGLRGEIGPGVTLLRFVLAMARGGRGIATPVPLGVSVDGAASERLDCLIVQVTTLERLFLGLRPFWGTAAAPLHFTSVRAQPHAWLRTLPALLRGRPGRRLTPANGYVSCNARQLELAMDTRFVVDGEIFAPTPGHPLRVAAAGTATFVRPD